MHNIFSLAGMDKFSIGLLSDAFLQKVCEMPYHNQAVKLLEKLINDSIHFYMCNNAVQEKIV